MKTISIAILGAAALLAACSSSDSDDANAAASAVPASQGAQATNTAEYFNVVVGDRVFFETDRHDLSSEAQFILSKQAKWFAENPGATAIVEGHADERGTRDYNLALGARRANSARAFLISNGVDGSRLRAVSFGKERPIAVGSTPNAWAQNRRAVTVIAGVPSS